MKSFAVAALMQIYFYALDPLVLGFNLGNGNQLFLVISIDDEEHV